MTQRSNKEKIIDFFTSHETAGLSATKARTPVVTEALAAIPDKDIDALLNLAWDYCDRNQYSAAKCCFLAAAKQGSLEGASNFTYYASYDYQDDPADFEFHYEIDKFVAELNPSDDSDRFWIAYCLYELAYDYLDGRGTEKDIQAGVQAMQRASDFDYAWACNDLGGIYCGNSAYRVDFDMDKAFALLKKASELPDRNGSKAQALGLLADIYGSTNYKALSNPDADDSTAYLKTLEYSKAAADLGNVNAMCAYALHRINGAKDSADIEEGMRYLEKARDGEDSRAAEELAHPERIKSAQDRRMALILKDVKCDEDDDPDYEERRELARIYTYGQGVPRDLEEAYRIMSTLVGSSCHGVSRHGTDKDIALFMTKIVSEHVVDDWTGHDEDMWWSVYSDDFRGINKYIEGRDIQDMQNGSFWLDISAQLGSGWALNLLSILLPLNVHVYDKLGADEYVIREGLTFLKWYKEIFESSGWSGFRENLSSEDTNRLNERFIDVNINVGYAYYRIYLRDFEKEDWKAACLKKALNSYKVAAERGSKKAAAFLAWLGPDSQKAAYAKQALLPDIAASLKEISSDEVGDTVASIALYQLYESTLRGGNIDEAYRIACIGAERGCDPLVLEKGNFKKKLFGGLQYTGGMLL